VKLMYEAGIPREVVQLLLGEGETIGTALINAPYVAGVLFTGSTETARFINQSLAIKPGPIVPLIAETGGQNALIVDSTALLEQVVVDVVTSAFDSAGQRCSALRVLFIQTDIADAFITLLKGTMDTLTLGDPMDVNVDVGPVIELEAQQKLLAYIQQLHQTARWVYQSPATDCSGFYVAPTVCEVDNLKQLSGEVFGPILHMIRYEAQDLDAVVHAINGTGYGLTFGMESRIETRYRHVTDNIAAGNAYVNRNIIGARVGIQPFGGQGLSGTGPKAGGPNYLLRLVHERVLTINTAAIGCDISMA
jgi:RHH-type proline utilization regulon transcriptional repressor/proline dehydrogenase/delta 1-pyrroline-5-carboxylate dehydrogenase